MMEKGDLKTTIMQGWPQEQKELPNYTDVIGQREEIHTYIGKFGDKMRLLDN